MTCNLNNLYFVLTNYTALKDIEIELSSLLKNGYGSEVLSECIYNFVDSNDLGSDYKDVLDDLIAAMEGHCHSTHILHPSHYTVKNGNVYNAPNK